MKKHLLARSARTLRRSGLLTLAVAGLAASPALAATTSSGASSTPPASLDGIPCPTLTYTQPFASLSDSNWYTMVPGETPDNLTGAGWTLSGGASIQVTTLADGLAGSVLNLPNGATAYTPAVCIDQGFQEARTDVRDVVGSEGVQFEVQPYATTTWGNAQNTGQVHSQSQNAWSLSGQLNFNQNVSGWELVRFEFVGGANPKNPSDFQISNFWVDPKWMT